jgi:hypothetical protein
MRGAAWRGVAFGVELSGTFPAPGLAAHEPDSEALPRVTLTLAAASELDAPSGASNVLAEQALPGGSFTISHSAGRGYRFDHSYYGAFRVLDDGSEVACAPSDQLPDWLWQRFLVAQPLPLASLLHGYEPLHASAVELGGRAVLVLGPSGAGKSSVALELTARGASFVADDVTVLELRDSQVVAHPGPPSSMLDAEGVVSLRRAGRPSFDQLGSVDGESRIVIKDASVTPLPIRAVYVLTRSRGSRSIEIVPPAAGRATVLLGGTFNAYLRAPSRLERQLEIAARVAETADVLHVRIPVDTDAGATADAILRSTAFGNGPRRP